MIRKCYLIYSLALFCVVLCVLPAFAGPKIDPGLGSWQMPDAVNGKKTQKAFTISNAGDEDLLIKEASACCGYHVVNLGSWSIPAGATTKLTLEFDPVNKPPGKYRKEITITSNDDEQPLLKIPVNSIIVNEAEQPVVPSVKPAVIISSAVLDNINVEDFYNRFSKQQKLNIIDVREAPEFSEKHIQGALNFPKSRFKSSQDDIEALFGSVDKKEISVVHCGGGFRSNYIAKKLRQYGWNAYNLDGGLAAWEKQGYPLIRGENLPPESEPLNICIEEAYGNYFILFKGEVLWIDTRSRDEFEDGHIAGAINIPLKLLSHYYDFIPKDKEVVLYCQGVGCEESLNAGRQLIANGFKQARIKVFQDGFYSWAKMNYPIEKLGRLL